MSRSKRTAGEQAIPAPRRKNIWSAGDGGMRTGWLLAASLFGYALVTLATRYGLIRAFGALFSAWGVDASNIHRAPAWARAVYVWHGSIATLVYSAATLALSGVLRRLWGLAGRVIDPPDGRLWRATLAGVLGTAVVAVVCLLPDSMRLEWPLTSPRLGWQLPVMAAVSLLSALAGEAFTKRVLYDGLRRRWGGLWATATVCGVFFLAAGGLTGNVISAVNTALMGLACCLLYDRHGLWTAVGFRWGWSLGNVFLLGFGGGETAVYRLYGVSEALLTGGDAGPMHGLWATLALTLMIVALARRPGRRAAED